MIDALTSKTMSPSLLRVAERARNESEAKFHSLAHLMDEEALRRVFGKLSPSAAPGVDSVTKEQYGQNLGEHLRELLERLKAKRYRHQPIRRVHIPKEGGQTRPIGVSTIEDKLVQGAVKEVLEAIYEQDFLDCSYGFRPGRSPHNAVRALHRATSRGQRPWVLEADIRSFFDSVDRTHLQEMLRLRIADGSMLRVIGKCLHVGVLDGQEYSEPELGTTQGSSLSPLLGNIYLHYVLDLWFEREVVPRLHGSAVLVRYADDFVIAFELKQDAERVSEVLPKRLGRYGLALHPDKTRLLNFGRPPLRDRKGKCTFDFLGFTWFWRRTRKGKWTVGCKTRSARLSRAVNSIQTYCKKHRHDSVKEQRTALARRLVGHYNYFGVSGNMRSLEMVLEQARRAWFKWLCRRSQRKRLNWQRFEDLLRTSQLPRPRIRVSIWA